MVILQLWVEYETRYIATLNNELQLNWFIRITTIDEMSQPHSKRLKSGANTVRYILVMFYTIIRTHNYRR